MRFPIYRLFAATALATGLSACVAKPPMLAEASYVDRVNVELKQEVASQTFAEVMKSNMRREASRYGRSGAPKEIRVAVTELHYKNALQSLIIGDANRVRAHVAVVDAATGRVNGEFDEGAIDNAAFNGVAGAIQSVTQDKPSADQRLALGLSNSVLEHVYGTAAAQAASLRQPVDYPETPAAAPAKPAPSKPAPARKAEPKTAMAGPLPATTTH